MMTPQSRQDRQKIYSEFIKERTISQLFLQPWWLDLTCNGDWNVSLIYRDGGLYDAIPYHIDKKYLFKLLRPPLITPYLANINYHNDDDFLHALSTLPHCDEIYVCRPSLYERIEDKAPADDSHLLKTTFFVDLDRDWEEIHQQIPGKRRAKIRKAGRLVSVHKNKWDSKLFQAWQSSAFNDKNVLYPYHKDYIQELIDTARSHDAVVTLAAEFEGQPVAYAALFYDQEKMYYLLGARDQAYNTTNAMSLLIYEAIRLGHEMGLKTFDFEGSSDEGIAHFFSTFSSVRSYYEVHHRIHSPLWKLKKKIFS